MLDNRQFVHHAISQVVNGRVFEIVITCIVIFNCIVIGVQTANISFEARHILNIVDGLCLAIYVLEIALKFIANPREYFKSGWNIFDFLVVLVSVLPLVLPFPPQIARIIRVLRTLRVLLLVSALEPLRVIVASLLRSLPSIFWTVFLLCIVCYVYGIAGFYLFGESFPEYFGDLGSTFFTLFQLTTLENWAEIARDVMSFEPWAALYFISFILIAAFIIVNVIVGVIVSSLEETTKARNHSARFVSKKAD